MTVRLRHTDMEDLMIEQRYPSGFKCANAPLAERRHEGRFFFGHGFYHEVYFEGIHISYGQLSTDHRTQIAFESDIETVEMHFALRGNASTQSDDGSSFVFQENQHNIIYASDMKGKTEWSSHAMRAFEVKLQPSFFQRHLPEDPNIFGKFRKRIEQRRTAFLSPRNHPITPAMHFLINEIISCQRQGIFKRTFLESKIMELLMLQLEQIGEGDQLLPYGMKEQDIEKMYAIKDILEKNMNEHFRLGDLARHVGTNEFTLKKGFRELFGTSVFDYWHCLKMEKAKHLLVEEGLSIREVSELVGYAHAHHFTAAFKKKYGVLPSLLRR